jgi:hypothetical protein
MHIFSLQWHCVLPDLLLTFLGPLHLPLAVLAASSCQTPLLLLAAATLPALHLPLLAPLPVLELSAASATAAVLPPFPSPLPCLARDPVHTHWWRLAALALLHLPLRYHVVVLLLLALLLSVRLLLLVALQRWQLSCSAARGSRAAACKLLSTCREAPPACCQRLLHQLATSNAMKLLGLAEALMVHTVGPNFMPFQQQQLRLVYCWGEQPIHGILQALRSLLGR